MGPPKAPHSRGQGLDAPTAIDNMCRGGPNRRDQVNVYRLKPFNLSTEPAAKARNMRHKAKPQHCRSNLMLAANAPASHKRQGKELESSFVD